MRYQTRHLFILPLILNHLTIFIYPNATFNKIIFYINSFYYKYPFDNNKATNSKPTNLTAKVVVQIETKYAPFIMWKKSKKCHSPAVHCMWVAFGIYTRHDKCKDGFLGSLQNVSQTMSTSCSLQIHLPHSHYSTFNELFLS